MASENVAVSRVAEESGWVAGIPLRNIWLLMLYASDLYRHLGGAKIEMEENPEDIPDLIAEILSREVERRLRRNLGFGYESRKAVLRRVRGKIDLLYTSAHLLMQRGAVGCAYDELTVDTPRNRFVREALEKVAGMVKSQSLACRCASLCTTLRRMGVTGQVLERSEGSIFQFGRHDAGDRRMVTAASLVFDLPLPTEFAGKKDLVLPDREIHWLRKLYEKGIAGFYDVVLSSRGWQVRAGKILGWPVEERSSGMDALLPSMRTDIVLDSPDGKRRLVIDTKFNALLVPGWYREKTLRSAYLYQIYSYLRSQEESGDPLDLQASGLLLHPSLEGEMVHQYAVLQKHKISFATVDLGGSAEEIRKRLLELVEVN